MEITVTVDTHEHDTVFTLPWIHKHTIVEKELPVGDVTISNGEITVHIEIKKGADIFSSKLDGRLDAQIHELNGKRFSLLAVIGDIYHEKMMFDSRGNEIPGVVSFFQNYPYRIDALVNSVSLSTKTRFFKDFLEFQQAIVYIIKKMLDGKLKSLGTGGEQQRILARKSDISTVEARRISAISAIQGINRKKAEVLLDAFNGDVLKVFSSDENSFTADVKGVGKKLYQNLVDFRGHEFKTETDPTLYTDTITESVRRIFQ